MAAWLIPALKAVLPHLGTIISAASPVFTRKKADAASNPGPAPLGQIEELQAAASQNAAHIKALAAQLQSTVTALERAALLTDRKFQRLQWLCVAAAGLSVLATGVALYAFIGQ